MHAAHAALWWALLLGVIGTVLCADGDHRDTAWVIDTSSDDEGGSAGVTPPEAPLPVTPPQACLCWPVAHAYLVCHADVLLMCIWTRVC